MRYPGNSPLPCLIFSNNIGSRGVKPRPDSTRGYALRSQGLPSPAPPLPPYRHHNNNEVPLTTNIVKDFIERINNETQVEIR
jgi:hypothetical protein